jgi:hypothetical protein
MAWPNTAISTSNLDSTSDSPAAARGDLYLAVVAVNDIVSSRGAASGIPSLDSSGYVPQGQINPNLTSISALAITIQPGNQRVAVENIINLSPRTVSQLANLTAVTGDVAYCSNGASGNVCLAVYTGANWKQVALGANIAA